MDPACSMCSSPSTLKCHERPYCSTHISTHISSDPSSTHTIIHPSPKPAIHCLICSFPPTLECSCSGSSQKFCSLCLVTHIEQSDLRSHNVQPIWDSSMIDSSFPLFKDKVRRIEYAKEKIKENMKLIENFSVNLERESEVIKTSILTHFEGIEEEITKAEQYLLAVNEELEDCKRNSEASELTFMQKHNVQVTKGKGIKLFEGNLEDEHSLSQLKTFAQISVKGEVSMRDLRVFMIKPRIKELTIIDLAGQNVSKKTFPKEMLLKDSGTWCEIQNRRIFYCGGAKGSIFVNEAYIVDPSSLAIVRLPPMNQSRALASVLYYKGKVYVFGGYSGANLASCECFDLHTEKWKTISDMPIARSAFSVVEYKGYFYITGESTFIDRYDPKTDCFLSYEGILPSVSNYSTMAICEETMFVQQNNTCFEIDIQKMKLKDAHPTPQGKWWSYFPAKVHDGQIYFSRYDDSAIWTFSIKTKKMNKIRV